MRLQTPSWVLVEKKRPLLLCLPLAGLAQVAGRPVAPEATHGINRRDRAGPLASARRPASLERLGSRTVPNGFLANLRLVEECDAGRPKLDLADLSDEDLARELALVGAPLFDGR